jgi:hypothetical protein
MLPMSVTKFAAAGCYVLALYTDTAWGMAIMFGLVAFFADIGLPAMWTLMQDISGVALFDGTNSPVTITYRSTDSAA